MLGIFVAVGFVGMVLAPCAIALYSKLGGRAESIENAGDFESSQFFIQPPAELGATAENTLRPVPLPAPVRVPSLQEVADRAAEEARQARIAAAHAQAQAAVEASRAATRRAAAAAKLAEAAERELVRATQAAIQAEAAKARAKGAQQPDSQRDYLPHDHPSLDFPRSRVHHPRRVA